MLVAVMLFATSFGAILPVRASDLETGSTQSSAEVAEDWNDADETEKGVADTVINDGKSEDDNEDKSENDKEDNLKNDNEDNEQENTEEEEESAVNNAEEDSSSDSEKKEAQEAVGEENISDNDTVDGTGGSTESASTAMSSDKETADSDEPEQGSTTEESNDASTSTATEELPLIDSQTQLVYEGKDYTVFADFDAEAKLPVGVELRVREITKESDPDEYDAYFSKALEEVKDKYDEKTALSFARFYDISFVYENEEVEPSGNIKIRIEYREAVKIEEETKVDMIHFDKEDEEKADVIDSKLDSEKKEEQEAVKAVEFESDRFSVYGVLGTS